MFPFKVDSIESTQCLVISIPIPHTLGLKLVFLIEFN